MFAAGRPVTAAFAYVYDDSDLGRVIAAKIRALFDIDYSPILGDIGEIGQLDSIKRIQSTKSGPDGKAWAPWSSGYAKSGRGRSLERRSGDLMAAIDYAIQGGDAVMLTADLPYAARQQFGFNGTDSRGRKIDHPARPYLGLSDAARSEIGDIVANHIAQTFRGAA
jgi:phage virion morphogenesis protein